MSFIEIKNVTKTFDRVDILKNLNITISEGTVLGILGRSGSGKICTHQYVKGYERIQAR